MILSNTIYDSKKLYAFKLIKLLNVLKKKKKLQN